MNRQSQSCLCTAMAWVLCAFSNVEWASLMRLVKTSWQEQWMRVSMSGLLAPVAPPTAMSTSFLTHSHGSTGLSLSVRLGLKTLRPQLMSSTMTTVRERFTWLVSLMVRQLTTMRCRHHLRRNFSQRGSIKSSNLLLALVKCKYILQAKTLNRRNTFSFSADIDIIADSFRLLLDNGVYYIGGPGFRENLLPTICAIAPGNICDAATIVAGAEPIAIQL